MDLFIMRHGIAEDLSAPGVSHDAERSLTPEGRSKLGQIVKAMHGMELSFDAILSSPYLRARQTAELVACSFKKTAKVELCDALVPDATNAQVVEMLRRFKPMPGNLLLVGHEPNLSSLVSLLVGSKRGSCVVFKKGGLCKACVHSLRPQPDASIEWLLTPKQMIAMA
jgi:phosphohistidine phosphatase